MSPFQERLKARLQMCPCCKVDLRETNFPEDGIPDGDAMEAVFYCGARVFITDDGDLQAGVSCPLPFGNILYALHEDVGCTLEDEGAQS